MILVERIPAGRPVAHVAAEMGVSRRTEAKWWGRYLDEERPACWTARAVPGAARIRRQPGSSAASWPLRRARKLGPARIASVVGLPASTVHRVLVRQGLNRHS
jgi:hypothetical protein